MKIIKYNLCSRNRGGEKHYTVEKIKEVSGTA